VMIQALPGIVVLKVVMFYTSGLYHGVWRHAGTPEVVRLVKASTLASAVALGGLVAVYGVELISLSVVILDWMLATGAVGATRFGFRALRQYFAAQRDGGKRVLVYGSSDHGLLVLRHLRQRLDHTVVGLLDPETARHGLQVQGVQVLGSPEALPQIVPEHEVDEVIVPVQNTTEKQRRHLADQCTAAGVDCKHFAFSLQPADETTLALPSTAGDGAPETSRSTPPS